MTTYRIPGGGGTELYVEETGPVGAPSVVFIHGLSQCGMAWDSQLRSDLADQFRLVTLDLRGHGRSARPPDGYGDSDQWADDVNAVIAELDLERPILCGWSYGGIVIGDYLRSYGADALGGVILVAATSRMGESAMRFLGPDFAGCLPGLLANDVNESMSAVGSFVRLCREDSAGFDEFYRVVGYTAMVPPGVRKALLSRTIDHDEIYAGLDLPVLIVHGLEDRIILPAMSEHLAALIPNATTSYYQGIGHSPFREAAPRFNDELRIFAAKSS
jgi:non-heme chloroperoxidase